MINNKAREYVQLQEDIAEGITTLFSNIDNYISEHCIRLNRCVYDSPCFCLDDSDMCITVCLEGIYYKFEYQVPYEDFTDSFSVYVPDAWWYMSVEDIVKELQEESMQMDDSERRKRIAEVVRDCQELGISIGDIL